MPTTPASPDSSAAVDRLSLGIDSPRGAQPSIVPAMPCFCFDASTSAVIFGCYGTACFEAEASMVYGACASCFFAETD